MTPLRHALVARLLLKACGGLEKAALHCRLNKTQLGYFQNAEIAQGTRPQFMPADVIADLERHCGQPIYSRALSEAGPGSFRGRSLMAEACHMAEATTAALAKIAEAEEDDHVTPLEQKQIDQALLHISQVVANISARNLERRAAA